MFEAIKPNNFTDRIKDTNPQTKEAHLPSRMNKKKPRPTSHYDNIEVFQRQKRNSIPLYFTQEKYLSTKRMLFIIAKN